MTPYRARELPRELQRYKVGNTSSAFRSSWTRVKTREWSRFRLRSRPCSRAPQGNVGPPMRARSILRLAWTRRLALALAASATAVIIDSGDGTGNTTTPLPDDPGWSNVGIRDTGPRTLALTGVYLGGRLCRRLPRRPRQHRARRYDLCRTCRAPPSSSTTASRPPTRRLRRPPDVPDPPGAAAAAARDRERPADRHHARDHGRERPQPRPGVLGPSAPRWLLLGIRAEHALGHQCRVGHAARGSGWNMGVRTSFDQAGSDHEAQAVVGDSEEPPSS